MPQGEVTAFFLFDVGDGLDLQPVRTLIDATVPARLSTKPPTPTYLQYQQPPLTAEATVIGMPSVEGFRARFKVFDYGVVSVALNRQLSDTWEGLLRGGVQWHDSPELASDAERLCRELLGRIRAAVTRPRDTFLTEDYLVFAVTAEEQGETADALLTARGAEIAQLLRGEQQPLSAQERDEVLRHRISYYATDVVITTWSSAFIYDTPLGTSGVLEILEFVNSQLLEFRYYDQLLDAELARTYAGSTGGQLATDGVQAGLCARGAAGARAVHRRQRADRSCRECPENRRRRLRGARVQHDRGTCGAGSVEDERAREVEDGGRHLSLCCRAHLDGTGRVARTDGSDSDSARDHFADALNGRQSARARADRLHVGLW